MQDLHAYGNILHNLITIHDKWKLKAERKYYWLKYDHIKFCPGLRHFDELASVYVKGKIWAYQTDSIS